MKHVIIALAALALSGCTTPSYVMKNEKTGQVQRCGGSAVGSMTGGMIGYHIQRSNDDQCVQELKREGFVVKSIEQQ